MLVLCGIDRSAPAHAAAHAAAHLAARLGAELRLVHVAESGRAGQEAGGWLIELLDDLTVSFGVAPRLTIRTGRPAERLAATAAESGCDLLVLGHTRRGRIGSRLLGSVHARVVRSAPCPVLVVPAGARLPSGDEIVLAHDPRAPSPAAGAVAGRLAAALGASITVAAALPSEHSRPRLTGWTIYDGLRLVTEAAATASRGHDPGLEVRRHRGKDLLGGAVATADGLDTPFVVLARAGGTRSARAPEGALARRHRAALLVGPKVREAVATVA